MSKTESILKECEMELMELFKAVPNDATDIVINPDMTCHYTAKGGESGSFCINASEKTLMRIASILASFSGQTLNAFSPRISCVLPILGYRVEILISPIVDGISFAIRVPGQEFYSIDALIKKGMLDLSQAELLKKLICERKNIAISGRTGVGKTTLLCALANEMPQNERIISIEDDTREIRLSRNDTVSIVAKKGVFSGRDAVRSALRMRPDRIIYGETRDGESAIELLKAFRTGHPGGLFTIHATSARQVRTRLRDLLLEVSSQDAYALIDGSLDAVVHLDADRNGRRRIAEIRIET